MLIFAFFGYSYRSCKFQRLESLIRLNAMAWRGSIGFFKMKLCFINLSGHISHITKMLTVSVLQSSSDDSRYIWVTFGARGARSGQCRGTSLCFRFYFFFFVAPKLCYRRRKIWWWLISKQGFMQHWCLELFNYFLVLVKISRDRSYYRRGSMNRSTKELSAKGHRQDRKSVV